MVVPSNISKEIVAAVHNSHHLGRRKTFEQVRHRFVWPNMRRDVTEFVQACEVCQKNKEHNQRRRQGMLIPKHVTETFAEVAIDLVGPLPTSKPDGFQYIVTMMDLHTRWIEMRAVKNAKTPAVARALVEEICCRHGCPRTLLSDRGSQFTSRLFREMCKLLSIKKIYTTAFHPMANGALERTHRVLKASLRAMVSAEQTDWPRYLPFIAFAMRTTFHATLKDTPFFLLHGRHARLPVDLIYGYLPTRFDATVQDLPAALAQAHRLAHEAQHRAQQVAKRRYDRGQRQMQFQQGDLVLLHVPITKAKRSAKLSAFWKGPYTVVNQFSPITYTIRHMKSRKLEVVHVQRLKTFHPWPKSRAKERIVTGANAHAPGQQEEKDLLGPEPAGTYVVERILKHRKRNGEYEFYVKWKGYAESESTWEPSDNVPSRDVAAYFSS